MEGSSPPTIPSSQSWLEEEIITYMKKLALNLYRDMRKQAEPTAIVSSKIKVKYKQKSNASYAGYKYSIRVTDVLIIKFILNSFIVLLLTIRLGKESQIVTILLK